MSQANVASEFGKNSERKRAELQQAFDAGDDFVGLDVGFD